MHLGSHLISFKNWDTLIFFPFSTPLSLSVPSIVIMMATPKKTGDLNVFEKLVGAKACLYTGMSGTLHMHGN